MTDQPDSGSPMPPPLRTWALAQLDGIAMVRDVSWPRPDSKVWRVERANGVCVFVKVAATALHYQRAVHALRHAVPGMPPGAAPRLVASDPYLLATITTALRGHIAHGRELSDEDWITLHRLEGGLLRHLHDAAAKALPARSEARERLQRMLVRSEARLVRAAPFLSPRQQALAVRARALLTGIGPRLPVAYGHGDFRDRNWIWDDHGRHDRRAGLLDFDRAGAMPAVADFALLASTTWTAQPRLRRACLSGYGRQFTPEEEQALPAFAVLAAVDDLQYAHRCGHAPGVQRALRSVEHLTAVTSP